ncbi:hypothetical protein C2845_PM01G37850 [Panicum miliaceum]|uniref:Uncharacterized protein n=1 Tax=Panicum miliaceum TaxID=4540 RepID=A0A3L6TGH0_PANMI|nr:hypothetical protein C2845_PM01G37850 [Panicum miliaceum]
MRTLNGLAPTSSPQGRLGQPPPSAAATLFPASSSPHRRRSRAPEARTPARMAAAGQFSPVLAPALSASMATLAMAPAAAQDAESGVPGSGSGAPGADLRDLKLREASAGGASRRRPQLRRRGLAPSRAQALAARIYEGVGWGNEAPWDRRCDGETAASARARSRVRWRPRSGAWRSCETCATAAADGGPRGVTRLRRQRRPTTRGCGSVSVLVDV